jgi:hypothetical protein
MNANFRTTASRQTILFRLLGVMLMLAFAAASSVSPAAASADVSFVNFKTELNNLQVGIYCGVNGYGEIVTLNGSINGQFYSVENAAGGILYRSKINGMNVTGIGNTTGATYQVTMISMGTSTLSDRSGYTSISVMNLIGRGTNSKAVVNMIFRVDVDAEGNERVLVDHYSAECR